MIVTIYVPCMHDVACRRGLLLIALSPKIVMESALASSLLIFCYFSCAIVVPVAQSNDIVGGRARTLLKNEDDLHASETQQSSGPKELYFCQNLDHFNFLDNRTWDQRYFLTGIMMDDQSILCCNTPTPSFRLGYTQF